MSLKPHHKKSTKPKAKGRLKPDIAFFWVYAWLQSTKAIFAERNEVTAANLHIRPASVTDRLKANVKAGRMFIDKKSIGRDADGYEKVRAFTVIQPPDALIRAARNWWEYDEAFGNLSPIRKSVSAETLVNSGDEPIRKSVLITADGSNPSISAVRDSQHSTPHIRTTEIQGERKSVSGQASPNQQVEPTRNFVSGLERELVDLRRKLQRAQKADKEDYVEAIRAQIANVERTIAQEGSNV